MSLSLHQKVSAVQNVLSSAIIEESVLLDLTKEKYFSLDDIGTRMWKVLLESESIGAAIDSLLQEYDVSRETLQSDVEELVEKLLAHGLVEVVD